MGLFQSILFLTPIFLFEVQTESLFWIKVSLPIKWRRKKRNIGIINRNVTYTKVSRDYWTSILQSWIESLYTSLSGKSYLVDNVRLAMSEIEICTQLNAYHKCFIQFFGS
jgi:hypothetical protein